MSASIKIVLYTEYRHHGSHGPKPRAVKSAVSSKARALLQAAMSKDKQEDVKPLNVEKEEKKVPNKTSKPYGSHGGNVHVQTLYSKSDLNPVEADRVLRYLDNLSSKFEAMNSFDLKAAKHEYALHKEEILKRAESKSGTDLSEELSTVVLKELAGHSFDYTQSQVVVTLIQDESFEGSHAVGDGTYKRELRTKRVYFAGKRLFSKEERDAMVHLSKEEVVITKTTKLARGARIVVNPKTGRRRLQIDFDQLADRIFDVDTY